MFCFLILLVDLNVSLVPDAYPDAAVDLDGGLDIDYSLFDLDASLDFDSSLGLGASLDIDSSFDLLAYLALNACLALIASNDLDAFLDSCCVLQADIWYTSTFLY